jgi:hypothetical protein
LARIIGVRGDIEFVSALIHRSGGAVPSGPEGRMKE